MKEKVKEVLKLVKDARTERRLRKLEKEVKILKKKEKPKSIIERESEKDKQWLYEDCLYSV